MTKFLLNEVLTFFLMMCFIIGIKPQVHAQTKEDQDLPVFTVDASIELGAFNPVNSVNGGPIMNLGNYYDNSEYFEIMEPPLVRLHDVPYAYPGAVDIHCIFPDFNADANDPENYHFEQTDLYIDSILSIGSLVIFRLGESIEKGPALYHIHPPTDLGKWVRVCCNIIRHYNMGWANGYEWNIRYWEIWNEPNIPNCWGGSMAQYCELYEKISMAVRELDPELKVGGPALAGSMQSKPGREFLGFCRDHKLPLDFVSWHGYADQPRKLMINIEGSIETIKEYGFEDAETIFGEWNYLPIPWGEAKTNRERTRDRFFESWGAPGAAFTASMFAYLLKSELDIACYYSAFGSVFRFSLFDIFGVIKKPFYSFAAYNRLLKYGTRIHVSGNNRESGLGIIGAVDMEKLTTAVLVSNFADESSRYKLELKNLPTTGRIYCNEYIIDDQHSLEWDREQVLISGNSQILIELPKATVRLLIFSAESHK